MRYNDMQYIEEYIDKLLFGELCVIALNLYKDSETDRFVFKCISMNLQAKHNFKIDEAI